MRKFKTVFMRGGTSKGCMFLKEDLPANRKEWDSIFLQVMGAPDPKQIDGLGGTVSSNNKIVIVWASDKPGVDVEYLVGQVVVGKNQVDYKSNCGNMTAAVGPFAVEEGLVSIQEPVTTVHLLNRNTDKYIDVTVPIDPKTKSFAEDGDCAIAGVDGTAAELQVKFLNPSGAKTGKLFPTGERKEWISIPDGQVEATILDVSNPLVMVRAEDVGLTGTELPADVNANDRVMARIEAIRAAAAVKMGFAKDPEDATANSPAVPKVGFFTKPQSYQDIAGKNVEAQEMDVCVRVISVFACHKACPLTAAGAISVASALEGTILHDVLGEAKNPEMIRIGHPSGVMTMRPELEINEGTVNVSSVAVLRTARRIMDGIVYVRN